VTLFTNGKEVKSRCGTCGKSGHKKKIVGKTPRTRKLKRPKIQSQTTKADSAPAAKCRVTLNLAAIKKLKKVKRRN
jgi:hypothetical protein